MQLKQDESRLLEYLKEKMQRVNELEKICSTMQEDMEEKAKERKRDDRKQVTDLKETLDHAIMTLSRNAEVNFVENI